MKKPFLFTPGPTPVPPSVRQVLSQPEVYHRSHDFKERFLMARKLLAEIIETTGEVILLTASGTGALEAATVSLHQKSNRLLVIDGGKFGERLHKVSRAYGLETDVLKLEWGQTVEPDCLVAQLKAHRYDSIFLQWCETSTGTEHSVELISELLRKHSPETLLLVDGITVVGARATKMDALGIDVLIGGSQKGLMMPPGLSFVALSAKAIKRLSGADLPRFYFNLSKELETQKLGQSAWTPSTVLVEALIAACDFLRAEGLPQVYLRHQKLAAATREALQSMGLTLASKSPAVACTAAFLPSKINGKEFLKSIRERYAFTIAGGQDQWEGKVIRLSHLGYYSPFDLLSALVAIGRELKRRGHDCNIGAAVDVFCQSLDL